MWLACLSGDERDKEELEREYKAATRYGEVRLGEMCLFYRYFIKIRYVAYEQIAKAYLREESGESGEFLLKEFYLMLETKDGVLHKLRLERDVNVKSVLAYLESHYKDITIGFNRPSRSI